MTHPQEHPNKYPGRCACCCEYVYAGAGFLGIRELSCQCGAAERQEPCGCRWIAPNSVYCSECHELYAYPWVKRDKRPSPLPPTGHYAITSHGENDLIFLKFERSFGLSATLRPRLKMVVGGKPDHSIAGKPAVAFLNRIISEGVSACALRYAQELGRCSRCNRTLTDEASRARGLGPECATR